MGKKIGNTHRMRFGNEWVDVPYWARYVAQDLNGFWYFYEFKPVLNEDREAWANVRGGLTKLAEWTSSRKSWKGELYRIDWER